MQPIEYEYVHRNELVEAQGFYRLLAESYNTVIGYMAQLF